MTSDGELEISGGDKIAFAALTVCNADSSFAWRSATAKVDLAQTQPKPSNPIAVDSRSAKRAPNLSHLIADP